MERIINTLQLYTREAVNYSAHKKKLTQIAINTILVSTDRCPHVFLWSLHLTYVGPITILARTVVHKAWELPTLLQPGRTVSINSITSIFTKQFHLSGESFINDV